MQIRHMVAHVDWEFVCGSGTRLTATAKAPRAPLVGNWAIRQFGNQVSRDAGYPGHQRRALDGLGGSRCSVWDERKKAMTRTRHGLIEPSAPRSVLSVQVLKVIICLSDSGCEVGDQLAASSRQLAATPHELKANSWQVVAGSFSSRAGSLQRAMRNAQSAKRIALCPLPHALCLLRYAPSDESADG